MCAVTSIGMVSFNANCQRFSVLPKPLVSEPCVTSGLAEGNFRTRSPLCVLRFPSQEINPVR